MTLSVAINGGGVAGWAAAAMLARAVVPAGGRVTVADDGGEPWPDGPALQVAPIGLPILSDLLGSVGLPGAVARATPWLGTAFVNWPRGKREWFVPFGDVGAALDGVAFHQLAARDERIDAADFSIAAVAAKAGRYAPPSSDPASPLSALDHGLTIDAAGLARLFEQAARDAGAEAGEIRGADLRIDVSDDRGIGDWEDWADAFPFARGAVETRPHRSPPFFALAEGVDSGWRLTLPLADRLVVASFAGGASRAGRRTAPWTGSTVALGPAAGRLPPLHGLPFTLLLTDLARLAELLPAAGADPGPLAAHNNAGAARSWGRARDLALLTMRALGSGGGAFSPELARGVESWASRGRINLFDGELFEEPVWAALLAHAAGRPARPDVAVLGVTPDRIADHLGRVRRRLVAAVETMPRAVRAA